MPRCAISACAYFIVHWEDWIHYQWPLPLFPQFVRFMVLGRGLCVRRAVLVMTYVSVWGGGGACAHGPGIRAHGTWPHIKSHSHMLVVAHMRATVFILLRTREYGANL